jgi:hypothetical protein
MNNPITGLPGIGALRTSTPREILAANTQFAQYLPGLRTIDGSRSRDPLNSPDVDVLRAGMVFGKTTAGNGAKYAPSILGVLSITAAAAATSLTVSTAVATELVRRIGATGSFKLTGPPSAAGTVATQTVTYSLVNTSTGVITCTAIGAAAIAGSFVQPTDGSETPITLLANRWGVKVTDLSGSSTDTLEDQFLVAAHVKTANIVNYPTDTSLIAWLKAALRTNCPAMTFDDSF